MPQVAKLKLKILFLTQFSEIGGGETILINLLRSLNRKLFDPIVIIPKAGSPRSASLDESKRARGAGQLSQKLKELKVKTYYLSLNPYLIRTFFIPGASPSGLWKLAALTRKIKPDLIHINHLTLTIYAGLLGKLLRIPTVATAHGPWDSFYFYQDQVYRIFVDKILANTPQTAKSLLKRKILRPNKVSIVPFGIDTTYFKPSLARRGLARLKKQLGLPSSFVVTIVGRLDPIKDHLTFLKAANIVRKKIKNVTFFIVGSELGDFSGQNNKYFSEIKSFLKDNPDLAKKVVFGGFIDDMPAVYHASDIIVSTSLSESFGLTIAEALACGIPVIASGVATQSQIVIEGKNGFLAPPKNPRLLAQKIVLLSKNRALRLKFAHHGRNHIVKNWPMGKYVQAVQTEYLKLLKISTPNK